MTGTFVPWNPANKRPDSRFAGWVEDASGCHLWMGNKTPTGYAQGWDNQRKRTGYIYRIRYEREVGPIPKGLHLDHFRLIAWGVAHGMRRCRTCHNARRRKARVSAHFASPTG